LNNFPAYVQLEWRRENDRGLGLALRHPLVHASAILRSGNLILLFYVLYYFKVPKSLKVLLLPLAKLHKL
jgi:hypothetical protein